MGEIWASSQGAPSLIDHGHVLSPMGSPVQPSLPHTYIPYLQRFRDTHTHIRRPHTKQAPRNTTVGLGFCSALKTQLSFLFPERPFPSPHGGVGGFFLWSPEPSAHPVTSEAALQFCVSLWILPQDWELVKTGSLFFPLVCPAPGTTPPKHLLNECVNEKTKEEGWNESAKCPSRGQLRGSGGREGS